MPYVSVCRQMPIGLLAPGLPGGELGRKLRTIVKQIVKLARHTQRSDRIEQGGGADLDGVGTGVQVKHSALR